MRYQIRQASKDDSYDLAMLINMAGEGLPEWIWSQATPPQGSPIAIGMQRAERDAGGFSYVHAQLCTLGANILGASIAYKQPDPYDIGDLDQLPEVIRPLVELEADAPGSWYINAIAVYRGYRGFGIGRMLMKNEEQRALDSGCEYVSLIVSSQNDRSKKFYEQLGYQKQREYPKLHWQSNRVEGDWLLMTKKVA